MGLIAQGGGKWGPMALGAAAWPMSKRPLEELVTALRKVAISYIAMKLTMAVTSATCVGLRVDLNKKPMPDAENNA